MIDFWLAIAAMLLIALAVLGVPVLRGARHRETQDRTGQNVALYQERLALSRQQHEDGLLDETQWARLQTEAARELLIDTQQAEDGVAGRDSRRALPIALGAVLLVPLLALGMYGLLGASDKVAMTREFATPPSSPQQWLERLQRAVAAQPEAPEGLYLLARAYVAQNRPGDAAVLFERAVAVSGRRPELLGQWAQALYFAAGKQWSARTQTLVDEALLADPNADASLGWLGINAFESQRYAQAVTYWQRLLALLPPADASRQALQAGIERARERGGDTTVARPRVTLQVSLAQGLRGQVEADDAVFIFVRALKGPAAPLAVRRVRVADLPIQVSFSDDDAMLPGLKLSSFSEVEGVARISRAGTATAGEWLGRVSPLATLPAGSAALIIDRQDSQERP